MKRAAELDDAMSVDVITVTMTPSPNDCEAGTMHIEGRMDTMREIQCDLDAKFGEEGGMRTVDWITGLRGGEYQQGIVVCTYGERCMWTLSMLRSQGWRFVTTTLGTESRHYMMERDRREVVRVQTESLI